MRITSLRALMAMAAMFGVITSVAWAGQEEEQREERVIIVRSGDEGEAQAPQYWLGVAGDAADEALLAQLGIDGGLVVRDVVDESPAAKAGLKKHDVLVEFGDKPIHNLEQLIAAIKGSDGEETKVAYLRGGKKDYVQVTPEKRPAGEALHSAEVHRHHLEGLRKEVDLLVEKLHKGEADGLRLLSVRPGIAVAGGGGAFRLEKMPANTKVTIRKEGEGPAKVEVSRDDKSWTVTEETLDELPEDLRGPVKTMLQGTQHRTIRPQLIEQVREGANQIRLQFSGELPARVHAFQLHSADGDHDSVHEKLDALLKAVEKIEKDLQELKESKQ